ncbi:sensor histidine kinase [Halalkalibacter lacteus]|uniref:sensor histidine kinase n=1 Tax=Halalkalibacter lacteus TaxID=3090663 RepID=UPI002FC804E7
MVLLLFETALDVISLFLIMLLVGCEKLSLKQGAIQWLVVILIFFLLDQPLFNTDSSNMNAVLHRDFEILPVQRISGLIGLLFLTLLMNSFVLKASHIEIIFVTMLGFIIWFLIRLFTVATIDLFTISRMAISPLILILTICFYWLVKKKFSAYIRNDFNHFVKLIIVSVFFFILYIILSSRNQNGLIIQPIFIEFVVLIVLLMLSWVFYEQKKAQVMENRMKAIEKYIPIIDELVAEVRSRQHEFSNKLLAISSILQSTGNMEDAREQVSKYVENVQLTSGQHELLNMDHKVIAGFLYTKMKRAEQLNMKLKIERSVSVSAFPCEDYDLIEVLGILIDNAIEACFRGDTILIRMVQLNDRYELTVSNLAEYMTNEQFMQLFKLGYSTKSTHSNNRGFGLYNVQQIAKQYGGKIIARNDQKNGQMITIGIQF